MAPSSPRSSEMEEMKFAGFLPHLGFYIYIYIYIYYYYTYMYVYITYILCQGGMQHHARLVLTIPSFLAQV